MDISEILVALRARSVVQFKAARISLCNKYQSRSLQNWRKTCESQSLQKRFSCAPFIEVECKQTQRCSHRADTTPAKMRVTNPKSRPAKNYYNANVSWRYTHFKHISIALQPRLPCQKKPRVITLNKKTPCKVEGNTNRRIWNHTS